MAASRPRIIYTPRPDATPESEARTLAAAYRFLLDRDKVIASATAGGDDAMKGFKDERADRIIRE